jgi:hypothetical protein
MNDYIEKGIVSRRFILAVMLIGLFAFGHISEGIVGAVIGYYFGSRSANA